MFFPLTIARWMAGEKYTDNSCKCPLFVGLTQLLISRAIGEPGPKKPGFLI